MTNKYTPRHSAPADLTPRIFNWLTPDIRRWLYTITIAAVPLLVTYGYLEQETAPQWIAVIASMLGTTTALAHTPKDTPND